MVTASNASRRCTQAIKVLLISVWLGGALSARQFALGVDALPETLRKSMGGHWELTQKNRKALEERNR